MGPFVEGTGSLVFCEKQAEEVVPRAAYHKLGRYIVHTVPFLVLKDPASE
jgi:hypothetical protein